MQTLKLTLAQNFKKANEIIWHYILCSCGNDKIEDAINKYKENEVVSIGYVFDDKCRSKYSADTIIDKWFKIKIR